MSHQRGASSDCCHCAHLPGRWPGPHALLPAMLVPHGPGRPLAGPLQNACEPWLPTTRLLSAALRPALQCAASAGLKACAVLSLEDPAEDAKIHHRLLQTRCPANALEQRTTLHSHRHWPQGLAVDMSPCRFSDIFIVPSLQADMPVYTKLLSLLLADHARIELASTIHKDCKHRAVEICDSACSGDRQEGNAQHRGRQRETAAKGGPRCAAWSWRMLAVSSCMDPHRWATTAATSSPLSAACCCARLRAFILQEAPASPTGAAGAPDDVAPSRGCSPPGASASWPAHLSCLDTVIRAGCRRRLPCRAAEACDQGHGPKWHMQECNRKIPDHRCDHTAVEMGSVLMMACSMLR